MRSPGSNASHVVDFLPGPPGKDLQGSLSDLGILVVQHGQQPGGGGRRNTPKTERLDRHAPHLGVWMPQETLNPPRPAGIPLADRGRQQKQRKDQAKCNLEKRTPGRIATPSHQNPAVDPVEQEEDGEESQGQKHPVRAQRATLDRSGKRRLDEERHGGRSDREDVQRYPKGTEHPPSHRGTPVDAPGSLLSSVDNMRKVASLLLLSWICAACSEDSRAGIATPWTFRHTAALAPPGTGPEGRVLVAAHDAPGRFWTLDTGSGNVIEGPFDTFPVLPAPVAIDGIVYLVTVGGRVIRLNLAGEEIGSPGPDFGRTTPLVSAPDTSIRFGTTEGRAVSIDAEATPVFDIALGAPVTSAPAVADDGTAYFATDTGRFVGLDPSGAVSFETTVGGPATGPSVFEDRVAVGGSRSVRTFDRATGLIVFARPRAARVVGTRFLSDGTLLAWGDDGQVELLDPGGAPIFTYTAGPPVHAPPVRAGDGRFGVVDSQGRAHLIGPSGARLSTLDLSGPPRTQVVEVSEDLALFTIENQIQAIDFNFAR